MKHYVYLTILLSIYGTSLSAQKQHGDDRFVTYVADPKKDEIKFYWRDDCQIKIKSIANLITWLKKKHQILLFAMNGGMYAADNIPVGYYVEKSRVLHPLDTMTATGNFYMKPNGVFYITTDQTPVVCATEKFHLTSGVNYATQSGPMLLIEGKIHPAFNNSSTNLNIRNGVGILPDGRVIFAMSKGGINFYDFAQFFKRQGCKNALYLDGFVSRTYLPEKNWVQTDGNFGVIIGVTRMAK
jgi:uncharacterized protein YigE (DUF2233 family)